jgi:hypothetical protein
MGETLHIHLHDGLRARAEAGEVAIVTAIRAALPGWRLVFHPDTEAERARAAGRGYGLFHMQEPTSPRILCLRRTYTPPFWRIERTNERWRFDVAEAAFDPQGIPPDDARRFAARLRAKWLGDRQTGQDGFLLMPLQGRLSEHRSFQSMSPLAMIRTTLDADPRPLVATLHPKEAYSPADRQALDRIAEGNPRFTLSDRPTDDLLARCDGVVTQNSSVALTGLAVGKPAVLFAGIDFHHPAGSVPRDGLRAAFAPRLPADFAPYLWWFFRRHAIDAGAADAVAQVALRLRRHGWPVEGP